MSTLCFTNAASLLATILVTSICAQAATQRSFVASSGSDANACSLAAPCRSFGAALAQTNAGGEIVVLDSAGYGAVTINKAVSIVAPAGVYAGVSVLSGDGVTITAGASDAVVLRGLTVNAQGGVNGVVFNSGAALHIEACTIRGFASSGAANVRFAPSGISQLSVKDSFVRGGETGILLSNSAAPGSAVIDNTRIENNGTGVSANTFGGSLSLRNVVITESSAHAVDLRTGAGQSLAASIDYSLLFRNGGNGLNVQGGSIDVALSNSTLGANAVGVFVQGGATAATTRLTSNVIAKNATGVQTGANGSILTPLSNTIEGNGVDGTATGSYTTK